MIKGLSDKEVQQRLKTIGYNELPSSQSKNILQIAFEVIKEPMFILLIICGSLYLLLGDYTEGITLSCWVFVIIFITFFQHNKTEKALKALQNLSSPRALVIRDGVKIRIAGREVVPEDIIILSEGDRIPADGVLFESTNLTIDESLLTGESIAINKKIEELIFSGTLVIQGRGIMKVTKTGIHTEFGKIGTSLQRIEQSQTNLQKEMKNLIRNLFIGGILICILVVLAFYITRGDFINSILNGLASAMAILPEEFPVVLTVFLTIGSWRLSQQKILTRKSSAIETLGSATVLCSDKTGTITQNKMEIVSLFSNNELIDKLSFQKYHPDIQNILKTAFLASQKDSVDPMEKAIEDAANEYLNPNLSDLEFAMEYPFSDKLLAMTRVFKKNNEYVAFCKGAPEVILSLCKLSNEKQQELSVYTQKLAEKGQRVLGIASATWRKETLPDSQENFEFEFIGFVGFADPIREEVPNAVKEANEAGIRVIMITGDYPTTAKSIAIQAGINVTDEVMTGNDLRKISDEDLKEKIQSVNVFARIVPEQKLRIIKALKANGEVVAMTGDGVNDAPALKAADIGISMGKKGTDVARESSSLVLLDDNFSSIVLAIRSGRKIYDNLQKAMSYIIAIHIPIIGLTLLPAFFSELPILLMPLHIVFMELIIDPVCSIAFESEKEEIGIMKRPPRNPKKRFFGIEKITKSMVFGLLLLIMVIGVYFSSIKEGHTDGEIRAIAFSSLIIGNIFLILTTLSKTRNVLAVLMEKNIALLLIIFSALGLMILVIILPYLRSIFSFDYPGWNHFIVSVIGSVSLLSVLEILKFINIKNSRNYNNNSKHLI